MGRSYKLFTEGKRFFSVEAKTTTPDGDELCFKSLPRKEPAWKYLSKGLTEYILPKCRVRTVLQIIAVGYALVFIVLFILILCDK
jgi:hypothetical protein